MFIWEKEVKKVDGTEVTFKDGSVKTYTTKNLKYLLSEEKTDDTQLRDRTAEEVAMDVLNVLEEHDIQVVDFPKVVDHVNQSLANFQIKSHLVAIGMYDTEENIPQQSRRVRISDLLTTIKN